MFLALGYMACSQSAPDRVATSPQPSLKVAEMDSSKLLLIGEWMYRGGVDNKYMVECPDVLHFDSIQYVIYNDCEMTLDNKEGIIEKGSWQFNDVIDAISLENREFLNQDFSNYVFHNSDSSLTIFLERISSEELWLCFDDKDNCQISKYIKFKR